MTKQQYIDCRLANDNWEILYNCFLISSRYKIRMTKEVFIEFVTSKLLEFDSTPQFLFSLSVAFFEDMFELTWITFNGNFVIAGSREDFLIE